MKPDPTYPAGRQANRLCRSGWLVRAAIAIAMLAASLPAQAQLDPLIALKRVPPRILIVFDTSFSMLYDMTGYDASTGLGAVYCDPAVYSKSGDPQVATDLGLLSGDNQYRRLFADLAVSSTGGYTARALSINSPTSNPSAWVSPCANTRYELARKGVAAALRRSGNPRLHWGLMRLRQNTPAWRIASSSSCDSVLVTGRSGNDSNPCATVSGQYAINPPTVAGANAAAAASTPLVLSAANQAGNLYNNYFDSAAIPIPTTVAQASANRLIPAGRDTASTEDRPLALTLGDAKNEVIRAMTADGLAAARNTVVVLIAAGRDFTGDPIGKATEFLAVSGGGATRRVPIVVVGVSPKTTNDETQLSRIATASGGVYVRASSQYGVERGINLAIQAGCQRAGELDAGVASEYPLVSPVIGTVNLEGAEAADGGSLSNDVITTAAGTTIPQRNNILLTSSFALGPASLSIDGMLRVSTASWNPGFEGRLRAYRAYKPVADSTKPSGYKFTKDGTPLWPNVDGRPETAGIARTPANPDNRNIFTYIPGTGMIAFSLANAATLRGVMNTPYAEEIISLVRRLPLGAIISSTPAVMDPPSLDPPPDEDYGRSDAPGTYAGDHKDRRSIIWIGANDGMLHAIDARTGFEVWAFIPYNLLPKLQTLLDGQSPYEFTYFMDQSPKIAEVKMGGHWKSMLVIGQGWGGTFYQAFDITEAGMGGPAPSSDDYAAVLSSFASATKVPFAWSFPRYSEFDPTSVKLYMAAADTTSFGRVKFFGDLKTTASVAEKKVGFTWSDPAVGALNSSRSVNAAIVGSGYFPPEADAAASPLSARQSAGVGRTLYLINMTDGTLIGNASGSACTGTGCLDVGDAAGSTGKNALQADPTVTSDYGSYVAKKAYMGDLDGNYWRFDFTSSGAITKTSLKSTGQPIYSSSALMWVGTTQQFIFFSTGSDMLPTSPSSTYGTGTFKMYALKESSGVVSDAFTAVPLAAVTNLTPESPVVNDANGRAVGIPSGERPSTSPSVAGEIVFFTTSVEAATAQGEPMFNLYAITYAGSNGYPLASGSTSTGGGGNGNGNGNGNGGGGGSSSSGGAIGAVKTGTGRATAPFVVDQHLYFATSSGSSANVEAFGDPNDFNNGVGQVGVRILSWREIRR